MGEVCGECKHYKQMPFCENICLLTGKVIPYLAHKECFEPKLNDSANKLTSNTNMETPKTKVCKDCGRELPIDKFGKAFRSKDGYNHICRECKGKRMAGVRRKEEEVPEVSPHMQKTIERVQMTLSQCDDLELVTELRERGWDVKCTRTIEI